MEEKFECDKCPERMSARKKLFIAKCPPVLIIHLKRFDDRLTKNNKIVDIPLSNFDFRPFLEENLDEVPLYDAYAIIMHHGVMEKGHYTTFCKINTK